CAPRGLARSGLVATRVPRPPRGASRASPGRDADRSVRRRRDLRVLRLGDRLSDAPAPGRLAVAAARSPEHRPPPAHAPWLVGGARRGGLRVAPPGRPARQRRPRAPPPPPPLPVP